MDEVPINLGLMYNFGITVYDRIDYDEYKKLSLGIDEGSLFFRDEKKNIYQLRVIKKKRMYDLRLAHFVYQNR